MSSQPTTNTKTTFSPPNSSSYSNSSTSAGVAGAAADDCPPSKAMSEDEHDATPNSMGCSRSPSPAPSSPATNNHRSLIPFPSNPPPTAARTPVFPSREDCWSEAATHTLIDAWGSHYLELNRGNLRRQHWMEVANAVNSLHGNTKKQHRTDIQCKNRIDTLKKKYKTERARVLQSRGKYVPSWPFFSSLDALIGDNFKRSTSPATSSPQRKTSLKLPPPPSAIPVGPRSKRPAPNGDIVSRRNFSAMAAAAAAAAAEDSYGNEESEASIPPPAPPAISGRRKRRGAGVELEGYMSLAEAIGKFGDVYKRVEETKLRQMVDLEKQRMQFAKDLELQRMKLIIESQVQLEKLKRAKLNSHAENRWC